jgi:hypothetical protein
MARRKKGELPRYRLHKQSGQAVVSLPGGGHPRYRDVLLGPFGSEESHREYTRVINEWLAAGRLSPPSGPESRCPDLTLAELVLRFWRHAEGHYRLVDGSPSRELEHFKYALMPAVELYGQTPAGDFGPLKKAGVARWHPHQLKHVCGTKVREAYGAEASRVYLGHAKLSTTEIYAEKDMRLVERIAFEVG